MRDSITFLPVKTGKNQGSHQFLNWWQRYATGISHLDGFESHPKIKTRYPDGYLVFMAEDEGFDYTKVSPPSRPAVSNSPPDCCI